MRFANFPGRSRELVPEPPLRDFVWHLQANGGSGTSSGLLPRKFANLTFGLLELPLLSKTLLEKYLEHDVSEIAVSIFRGIILQIMYLKVSVSQITITSLYSVTENVCRNSFFKATVAVSRKMIFELNR